MGKDLDWKNPQTMKFLARFIYGTSFAASAGAEGVVNPLSAVIETTSEL